MGRRTDIFGPDPDIFRPERFLEASPGKREEMEKTTDLMFGYGRYRCLGRNMAWLEMEKVFVEVSEASFFLFYFSDCDCFIELTRC